MHFKNYTYDKRVPCFCKKQKRYYNLIFLLILFIPILLVLTLTCNHHQFGVDLSRSYSKCFIVVAAICSPLHWRDRHSALSPHPLPGWPPVTQTSILFVAKQLHLVTGWCANPSHKLQVANVQEVLCSEYSPYSFWFMFPPLSFLLHFSSSPFNQITWVPFSL